MGMDRPLGGRHRSRADRGTLAARHRRRRGAPRRRARSLRFRSGARGGRRVLPHRGARPGTRQGAPRAGAAAPRSPAGGNRRLRDRDLPVPPAAPRFGARQLRHLTARVAPDHGADRRAILLHGLERLQRSPSLRPATEVLRGEMRRTVGRLDRRAGTLRDRAMAATLLLSIGPTVPPSIAQTIDTIVVRNSNVFDRHDDAPGFLARLANALHIRTQAAVIRRTLLVNPGEPYDSARVAESERALRALDVFRRVELDTLRLRRGLALRVTTADGWSTKPQAGFSSAGGDQTWEIGIVEQNLLGTATELAAAYRDTPDRQILELQYQSPHFLTRRATLLVRYADLSDGERGLWRAGLPFYQTAARRSLETDGEAASEHALVFRTGALDTTLQIG